jgi:hypothetical protein
MSKLEPWQRYRKATPCPVCGGYGAYKPENRCKGFLKADGSGAYCSSVADSRSALYFEALGLDLYFHPLDGGEGEQVGREIRNRILMMCRRGTERRRALHIEARRPPTGKDFG